MSRGDHPQRTPLYGALLIVAAMLGAVAVTAWSRPSPPVRAIVLIVCLGAALTGVFMTMRDNTPRR